MNDQEPGKRQVLNAFVGMTNIIEEQKIDEVMIKTFSDIVEILSDYCGPYGKYAVITNPENPTAQPNFTKDGLNIVRAIEFISPMERYVKDTMAYVAQRVERTAGDGTTSTMIMVASIMENIKTSISDAYVSHNEFVSAYRVFSDEVIAELDRVKIIPTSQEEIYNVAMAQSMTSSHNNQELSKRVAELYSTTPQQAWDYTLFERERKETDEAITVKYDESDYSMDARIHDNKFYNTRHGDGFELEDTEVVILMSQMISNSMEFNVLMQRLQKAVDNNEKLVIVGADGADVVVRTKIDEIVGLRPGGKIGIFSISTFNPNINDHVALLSVFDFRDIKDSELATLKNVDVKYIDGVLSISNYWDKTDDMLHPKHEDEESNTFKFLKMIEEFVDRHRSGRDTVEVDRMVKEARRIYNNVLLQKQGRICIGGTAYDSEALVDVVQDAMKATRATLLKGAVLGGYQTLKKVLVDCKGRCIVQNTLVSLIYEAFIDGIETLSECSMKHLPAADAKKFRAIDPGGGEVYNVAIKCVRTLDCCLQEDKCAGTVLQPVTVDKELIRRFGEVALKFMFMNRVIIPGGIVVDQLDKD